MTKQEFLEKVSGLFGEFQSIDDTYASSVLDIINNAPEESPACKFHELSAAAQFVANQAEAERARAQAVATIQKQLDYAYPGTSIRATAKLDRAGHLFLTLAGVGYISAGLLSTMFREKLPQEQKQFMSELGDSFSFSFTLETPVLTEESSVEISVVGVPKNDPAAQALSKQLLREYFILPLYQYTYADLQRVFKSYCKDEAEKRSQRKYNQDGTLAY